MRSYLFVPGHNEKLLESAKRSDADCLILDLEDSVPDLYRKKARELVEKFECDKPAIVRIKVKYDLNYLGGAPYIMVPGATIKKIKYYSERDWFTIPLIETTQGVMEAYKICKQPNVVAVAFGGEDFKADLQGTDFYTARAMVAMAARAAGVEPIDTVYTDLNDHIGICVHLEESKAMGYRSMLCLHPKQIPYVHKYFTPSDLEIKEAEEIIRLSEQAAAEGKGVAVMNGVFIGPPMVKKAHKILDYDKDRDNQSID